MAKYAVPMAMTERVKKEMKRPLMSPNLLDTLDTQSVNESKKSAFNVLFEQPEIETILEMFDAFDKIGISGQSNPAALGVVLNLQKLRDRHASPEGETAEGGTMVPVSLRRIQKRHGCHVTVRFIYGTIVDHCYRCPVGSNCKGMCGPRCLCVRNFCGTCCYYRGCWDHDTCCEIFGYLHYSCALVFPFNCARYRYQCRYIG